MSDSLIPSFFVGDVSESLKSLTKNERMSELLVFFSAHSLIFFAKNEQFKQKTDEQIPSPGLTRKVWPESDFFQPV